MGEPHMVRKKYSRHLLSIKRTSYIYGTTHLPMKPLKNVPYSRPYYKMHIKVHQTYKPICIAQLSNQQQPLKMRKCDASIDA